MPMLEILEQFGILTYIQGLCGPDAACGKNTVAKILPNIEEDKIFIVGVELGRIGNAFFLRCNHFLCITFFCISFYETTLLFNLI